MAAPFAPSLREAVALRLAANFTTTLATAVSTLLAFAIGANEVWIVDIHLTTQCSSTGGVKYAIAAPAGAAIEGWISTSLGALTTPSYQRFTAINTLTATAAHIVATTPGPDIIRITVTNGATPGVVTLQAASGTATQSTTIFAGASLVARRAA